MIIIFLLIIPFKLFSQEVLTFDEIELSNKPKNKVHKVKKKKNINQDKNLKKELAQTKKLLDSYRYISKMQLKNPIFLNYLEINEGEFVRASSLFSIFATKTPSKATFNNIEGANLPSNSKIICTVATKYKRICGKCNRLIIDGQGYDIDADIRNPHCITGELISKKDEHLKGMLISELSKGALAISQDSRPTLSGNVLKSNPKNMLTQGLINTANEATSLLKDEYQNAETIVKLKRKSKVIIHFNKRVSI